MTKNKLKIFIDFDGTITKKDVGEEIILNFGDPEKAFKLIELWMADKLNSGELWLKLYETIKSLDEIEFNKFLNSFEIDDYFQDFISFCKENDLEVVVLSDGFDYYISRILFNSKLDDLPAYSNKLKINYPSDFSLEFPHSDSECTQCANCKRNHIINNSSEDDFTIYIGDGYSDKCPAQFTDYIFAKRSLLKFCDANRISYFPFNNFKDVMERVNSLVNKKRLKKRHQAELKRRKVYAQG
ncbi:MAG: MtnX-like HAD-IB family phosphatase [Bacteroidetes bacterium]|nr:MtnX-like HAD-IB family phosphatase [Bacteroidota bacterium]